MKNTLKAFCYLFFGLVYSYSIQAQKRTSEEIVKEFKDYMDYAIQLEDFQKLQAKGGNSITIPTPWGLDPVSAEGENTGNPKSWGLYRKTMGNLMASAKEGNTPSSKTPLIIEENEKGDENTNNAPDDAQQVLNFGTGENQMDKIRIKGSLGESDAPPIRVREESEDNHSFSRGDEIIFNPNETLKIEASIENLEKRGTLSGDYDVYNFFAETDKLYTIDIQNTGDSSVRLIAFLNVENDPESTRIFFISGNRTIEYSPENDSGLVTLTVVSRSSFETANRPDDFDAIYPLGDETAYSLTAKVSNPDTDTYRFDLRKGDVFGVAGTGASKYRMILISSDFGSGIGVDGKYGIFPEENSPLPTSGDYGFHYLVPRDGSYFLFIDKGSRRYDLEIAVSRPGLEIENPIFDRQIIFLNMAGAEMSLSEFYEGNRDDTEVRTLSGLESFMENWDLEKRQVADLADKIETKVTQRLRTTLAVTGNKSDVIIFSDFGDAFMRDALLDYFESAGMQYSRLIIAGTVEEFGSKTRGVASSIDVGNFDLSDNAIVLAGLLSSKTELNNSINSIPMAADASKIDLVAEVLGNLAAHEVGHFLGNWHSDNTNDIIGIMDRGGQNIGIRAGVLEGNVYGGDENIEVLFEKDEYSQSLTEIGFLGINETNINTSFALASPTRFAKKGEEAAFQAFLDSLNNSRNLNAVSSISSYPNPQKSSEVSTLVVSSPIDSFLNINLFDLQGRKISEIYTGASKAGVPMELNLNPDQYHLDSGVYFYKINDITGQRTHRIVVE